jgi:hypothetical protein
MCKAMIVLVRTDTDIDEHERLSNISLLHKLREQCFYCCSTLHRHSRTFNNEQKSMVCKKTIEGSDLLNDKHWD